MPGPDWTGDYCANCGGYIVDPEPWHAHDQPMSCETCDMTPSLGDLVAWQRVHGMEAVHLVNVRADGFDLAHTDAERDSDRDLTACPVHRWLIGLSGPPATPGRYRVAPSAPYDLEALCES